MTFDSNGYTSFTLPPDCIADCSAIGQVYESVKYWRDRLDFVAALEPVLDVARDYLREFGAWDDLDAVAADTIADRVLWTAACECKENGTWFGLVH